MNGFKSYVVAAMLFVTPIHAEQAEFSEVDVVIQLRDENSNAMALWPAIETDMEAIIRQRISTIYNPNGLHVDVSVGEISFDGVTTLEDEFNTLKGLALVREEVDGPVIDTLEFGRRAQTWDVVLKEGMTVLPDKEEFYIAMLNRFADSLVDAVNGE